MANAWYEHTGVALTHDVESILTELGKYFVPIQHENYKVIGGITFRLGVLVRMRESSTKGMLDVEDAGRSSPGVFVVSKVGRGG